MSEAEFIDALRALATHPGARGLADDAAVLGGYILTHDMLVEGVHFRSEDAPADVAWKLLAVNLSDLAAKGARPVGVMMGYTLRDPAWDSAFVAGLATALERFGVPLLGGDTVRGRGARTLTLTAIGEAGTHVPGRDGARPGDALWVTGMIGRAGAGLRALAAGEASDDVEAYLRPQPRLAEGAALAPIVAAMMDVSDGLLIDATRMATASGCAVTIDVDAVPVVGEPMAAVTAGDDYELLFALGDAVRPPVRATRIGRFAAGAGLSLTRGGAPVVLPARLGWEH